MTDIPAVTSVWFDDLECVSEVDDVMHKQSKVLNFERIKMSEVCNEKKKKK